MADSILDDVKEGLDISAENTAFDKIVVLHINSALTNLNQLGIGPTTGFGIENKDSTWGQFFQIEEENRLNNVKTFVVLQVRMWFDTPPTGPLITAYEKQLLELTTRISMQREEALWMQQNSSTIS